MELKKLKSVIESLLFISGEPIKIAKLAKIMETEKSEVENAVMILTGEYVAQDRGWRIIQNGDEIQLVTDPGNSIFVEKLTKSELQENLSPASLEVLSIIAYRGPITKASIESIRGVNSSYTLRNLLIRGLIEKKENPIDARTYIYEITFDLLRHLGIDKTNKLPDYEVLSKDGRIDSIIGSNSSITKEQ